MSLCLLPGRSYGQARRSAIPLRGLTDLCKAGHPRLPMGSAREPMSETALAHHVSVNDAPDGAATTIQIRDSFVNYALSEDLKRDLKDFCHARMRRGVRRFVIDLSTVTVMDSCGLSVLISVKKAVEGGGCRLAISSLSPMIARLLEVTKLDRSFEIHATAQAALSAA